MNRKQLDRLKAALERFKIAANQQIYYTGDSEINAANIYAERTLKAYQDIINLVDEFTKQPDQPWPKLPTR